jgi:hypothetical protein
MSSDSDDIPSAKNDLAYEKFEKWSGGKNDTYQWFISRERRL